MLNFVSVPLKKASNVNLAGPLNNLIKSMYSTADQPEDFSSEIDELQKLRKKVTSINYDDRNAPLDDLFRYYDQIYELERRIPLNEFMVAFKWKNAYETGYLFGSRSSLTVSSLSFERIAILFNIAAALSKQAVLKSFDNDEELKLAIKLFQQSAGAFDQLKTEVIAVLHQEPTSDLNNDSLRYLTQLMLAQAQELFIQKAIKDKMKNGIVAKLCKQCEALYEDLSNIRVASELDDNYNIQAKLNGYHALSEYFQSLICKENRKFGEEITRLQNAAAAFKKQQSYTDKITFFQTYVTLTGQNLDEVLKYNNLIYNEMVPNYETLPQIEKTLLAKIIPVQVPLSSKFKDLFANLIPVVVHQGLAAYDIRRNELINNEINSLREANQVLNGILASLNLPAAIEVTEGDDLPQSIVEKAMSVKQTGGIDKIEKLINELPDSLKVNNDMLIECENLLREEKESDDNIRKQFKEKWNRTPSEKLTKVFVSNISEYRNLINKAVEADKFVRNKYETAKNGIKILSLSPDEIKQKLPGHASETNMYCASANKLRELMTEVNHLKQEREQLEDQLKNKQFDMKTKLIESLSENGFISEELISIEALHENYGELQKLVEINLSKQEKLIEEIHKNHENFVHETGQSSDSREEMLKELATAYDAYHSLISNLEEGNKFYNNLIPIFMAFQNKIKDYCTARKIEKEELLKDLAQALSKSEPTRKPSMPSYYDTSTVDGPTAPITNQPLPYPLYNQVMPMPFSAPSVAPYPAAYCTAVMPQGYNPYMTLPYPVNYQVSNPYATYPRTSGNQNR